jgi:hypothetical protein
MSEVILNWIAPVFSWHNFQDSVAAIGSMIGPYLPIYLKDSLSALAGGILLIIVAPFSLSMNCLPYLHFLLGYLPYSNELWIGLQWVGNHTLAYIPWDSIAKGILKFLGL